MGDLFSWQLFFLCKPLWLASRSRLGTLQSHAKSRAITLTSLVYMKLLKKVCNIVFNVQKFSHFWPTETFPVGHAAEDLFPVLALLMVTGHSTAVFHMQNNFPLT